MSQYHTSPKITPPSTPPPPTFPTNTAPTNAFADIFSDSPPTSPSRADPSDIPRLRSIQITAGYREGVAASKSRFIQAGFDEGYSLGARFGLRIGRLLGVLEGLWSAYDKGGCMEERERLGGLVREAMEELKVEKVFGRGLWGAAGWEYKIVPKGGGEATVHDVVDQHPVIAQWEIRVRKEWKSAGIRRGRFEGAEWEKGRVEG